MPKNFWEYSPFTQKGHKKTKLHCLRIAVALVGNKNMLARRKNDYRWSTEAREKRKREWIGKTWSSAAQFKKADRRLIGNKFSYIHGNGYEPYTAEFNERLKGKMKKRDGNICKLCKSKSKLSVHHINYNKKDCREENLITLCMPCNTKANIKWFREGVTTRREVTNKNWLKVWSELMREHKKQAHKNLR